MKIIIQGREYTAVADDSITLADLVVLKAQTGLSRADLFDLFEQVQGLSEAPTQRSSSPASRCGWPAGTPGSSCRSSRPATSPWGRSSSCANPATPSR